MRTDGRTDRHDEDNRYFSNFFSKAPKKTRQPQLAELVIRVTRGRKWHSVKHQIDPPSLVTRILNIFHFTPFKINYSVSLRVF